MNSKETKINIVVNVAGERVSFPVLFSEQDTVRMIESEIRLKIMELKAKYPRKGDKEILAMAAYHYASAYYYLAKQRQQEIDEAENLLNEAERLCGDACTEPTDVETDDFDVY